MSEIERHSLAADLQICRILNGMWQVSGAHGYINPHSAVEEMLDYHDCGLVSWDMADIYGPAEDFFGEFRRRLAMSRGEAELARVTALTKFVPNPGPMSRPAVEMAIDRSLARMNVPIIDAVQLHWWDYDDPHYLDAMRHLTELRDREKIRHIALTNFDTQRMQEMADAGFRFVSNQVQYSLIDQRPSVQMAEFCKRNKIGLLAYGTLCGGFLSERYLNQPEPANADLGTASLQKYKHMIDAWGGWKLFQELLLALDGVAKKHHVSIANVATRYVLDKPQVAGVIIGARLGMAEHRSDNIRAFSLELDSDDLARIDDVSEKSRNLFAAIGDCGDEYR